MRLFYIGHRIEKYKKIFIAKGFLSIVFCICHKNFIFDVYDVINQSVKGGIENEGSDGTNEFYF